jgi:hypothetical protein
MKLGFFIAILSAGICLGTIANAQLAPTGEFKNTYTKELGNFETQLKAGKQMEAERSYQVLLQMHKKHRQQLEVLLKKTNDKEENGAIAERIMDEDVRAAQLKEMSNDMMANKKEMLEEMNSFLDE